MWKTLATTSLLTLVLGTLTAESQADPRHGRSAWSVSYGTWNAPRAYRWGYRRPGLGVGHGIRRHHGAFSPFGVYRGYRASPWPAFGAGALLGSTLTYGVIHDSRGQPPCRPAGRARNNAPADCYRIERLPGGRERRIELPSSACR